MAYEALLYDVNDGVATITINRPERRNALSWTVMSELRAAFEAAKADRDVRVVTLTGAGDKAFCAGADISSPRYTGQAQHDPRGRPVPPASGSLSSLSPGMWTLAGMRQPVIAMAVSAVRALMDEINGHPAPHSEYIFRPELVMRGSTAAAGSRHC